MLFVEKQIHFGKVQNEKIRITILLLIYIIMIFKFILICIIANRFFNIASTKEI